ncbi:apocarotenoid-15/15'-oxygenase [Synechococcus sp. RS9909]|uniref:carotenoid oxygenase family protein n=1 Tax=unclassified Synechococcus TaxID=2626047 RepID=UPI00006905FB|nr:MULTISPECIES: carotenoid oxygenase family protein [unclassified Synechococcus]EAQ70033.1 lignostilbene-alpha,beta-dioxygenase-like protein [Synechococcus sp. RS9917]QNI78313.1 apocarotenoid-15/15'-oxygenase [Synechococcus sp. RS9909]
MTVAPAADRFNRDDWASAFRNVEQELTNVALHPVRGTVPPELVGTLYRNGPGRLERGGQRVHHPFDGDGMITALRFDAGGAVSLSNRFVRTAGWLAEEAAQKVLYRGVFGSQKPGGPLANAFDLRLKNIANTGVVRLGDALLALWEAAEPHALDPDTLETHGLSLLGGVLSPGEAFSAHPRFDPGHHGRPRLVSFGVKTGPRSTIRLMEFATEDDAAAGIRAGDLLSERRDSFNGFAFLHDFAITPNWAVFLQNAVAFNPLPFVLGQKGAAQCLQSKPGGQAKFWLIPRDGGVFAGQQPRIIDAPEGFVFHHLNAWEQEGDVVVESIYYSDFPSIGPDVDFTAVDFDLIPEGLLEQCRIHLESGQVTTTRLSERCCEFAMVNPHREGLPCRFAWMAAAERERGNDPLQVIKKLDLHTGDRQIWSAAPRGFVSEPLMVPRPGAEAEDDGWVLELFWNGERQGSDLVILDAADLRELAAFELPLAIPHGLHGSWVPSLTSAPAGGSPDGAAPQTRAS